MGLAGNNNAALALSQRQKRLQDWHRSFEGKDFRDSQKTQIAELLSTYALLISRMTKPTNDEDRAETAARLFAIERELNSFFEKARLLTSDIHKRRR